MLSKTETIRRGHATLEFIWSRSCGNLLTVNSGLLTSTLDASY